jgi:hypothetical protein
MPVISSFFGIVIRMYYDEHAPPHFHVAYQDDEAVLRIDTLEVSRGQLPIRARNLVVEWAVAHRQELWDDWARAVRGEPLITIAPLE